MFHVISFVWTPLSVIQIILCFILYELLQTFFLFLWTVWHNRYFFHFTFFILITHVWNINTLQRYTTRPYYRLHSSFLSLFWFSTLQLLSVIILHSIINHYSYVIWQLAGTKSSILGLNCCGIVIADNELQKQKHPLPISMTEDGMEYVLLWFVQRYMTITFIALLKMIPSSVE